MSASRKPRTKKTTTEKPTVSAVLPAEGYARPDVVCRVFGVSGPTLWRWYTKKGSTFPKPYYLSPTKKLIGFSVAEIREYMARIERREIAV